MTDINEYFLENKLVIIGAETSSKDFFKVCFHKDLKQEHRDFLISRAGIMDLAYFLENLENTREILSLLIRFFPKDEPYLTKKAHEVIVSKLSAFK